MDDIDKILEKLDNLENTVNKLKEDLERIQNTQDNQNEEQNVKEFFKESLLSSNELFGLIKEIRRQLKRSFRQQFRQSFSEFYDRDFDVDFTFDFSNLGDYINETVHSALSSLEGLMDSFDTTTPRRAKIRVQPGTHIVFEHESGQEYEVFPELSDKEATKTVLKILEKRISSEQDLRANATIDEDKLTNLLMELKDKKLIIQEKLGNQRFMVTKLGRKLLKELEDQKDNEDVNN